LYPKGRADKLLTRGGLGTCYLILLICLETDIGAKRAPLGATCLEPNPPFHSPSSDRRGMKTRLVSMPLLRSLDRFISSSLRHGAPDGAFTVTLGRSHFRGFQIKAHRG